MGELMDISKAVAAAVRGMGLKPKRMRARAKPVPPETAPAAPLSSAEVRVQRANLRLLETAGATLARTIALLK